MHPDPRAERPAGVYLVALYFVLAGFLEAIQKYRELDAAISLSPLAEHSIWVLAMDPVIYSALAYLIWQSTSLGRLAALVYGYLVLGTYSFAAISYFTTSTTLNITPLFLIVGTFHVVCLVPVLWYLQPARQKKRFHVSLWEILLS